MRLKTIKLAGFKSFVDPTTIVFNHPLTAIVGPNGCGKSNIIDAILWVMGESSAKYLRGESMSDVIFNGANGRKPVSQASVELIFDNSSGRVSGHFGQYNELSIKRSVSRENQSQYSINGTRCRRKDVMDIFLGTGLGPRSYAIIGQGTISRLVEAKPDELRHYLEEAAGISKYKERRKETEQRMKRTQENLERLLDLQEELDKQVKKLKQQSEVAERFKRYKTQEREKKAQLCAMKWQTMAEEITVLKQHIRQHELTLEQCKTDSTQCERQLEEHTRIQDDQQQQADDQQAAFYQLNTEHTKLEQQLLHLNQQAQQTQKLLSQAQKDSESYQSQHEKLTKEHQALNAALLDLQPKVLTAQQQAEQHQQKLQTQEHSMSEWLEHWNSFTELAFNTQKTANTEQAKIQELEAQLHRLAQRKTALQKEQATLDTQPIESLIAELTDQTDSLEHQLATQTKQQQSQSQYIQTIKTANLELEAALRDLNKQLQHFYGRKGSLDTLQEAALGKDKEQHSKSLTQWIHSLGAENSPRLAECLQVTPEWQAAVECVLGESMQAITVNSLQDQLACVVDDDSITDLRLFQLSQPDATPSTVIHDPISHPALAQIATLASQVSPAPAEFHHIYLVDTFENAISLMPHLQSHQSLLLKNGAWLWSDRTVFPTTHNAQQGVLHRQAELKQLGKEIEQCTHAIQQQEQLLNQGIEQLSLAETQLNQVLEDIRAQQQQKAHLSSQLSGHKAKLDQFNIRQQRVEQELQDIAQQTQDASLRLKQARLELQTALDQMATQETQREELKHQKNTQQEALTHCKQQAHSIQKQAHELQLQEQKLSSDCVSSEQKTRNIRQQIDRLDTQISDYQQQLIEIRSPEAEWQQQLASVLEERLNLEAKLNDTRALLAETHDTLQTWMSKRNEAEKTLLLEQQQLQNAQLKQHSLELESQHQIEQLTALETSLDQAQALLTSAEQPEPEQWKTDISRLEERIKRLGAINLAALEEYEAAIERTEQLTQQREDLNQALRTLEQAISKIDKETRERFKSTYSIVNEGFQTLFPKIFGGGSAYLELTGDNLLETGVAVMARPPGKRNSTIHLLSGGEKALTAIALVFAIFELNPAPFCMLDEVDAPLDDSNLHRFCHLVESMAERIQFIYISHNKMAMEMAHQLVGVTMSEPGVSRLVSVNIEEASTLATA